LSSLKPIGLPFIELLTVDSTNNYAMGMVHAGMARHGMAVFTHHQTKGRGQRHKQWVSEANSNIAISIIIEPQGLGPSQLFLLSKAIATGALIFFKSYATTDVSIKWPNDIYWRDRKAGGILIENILQGNDWKYAIAGIGLNINQTRFGQLEHSAVSLKQITGKSFEPLLLAKELCKRVDEQYTILLSEPAEISNTYHSHLFRLNQKIRLKKGSQLLEAFVKQVTDQGQLVVQHGAEEQFNVGEVEWLL
jgi:BirA family biotin operon repressor/biotin-[acetyl-CoA-carboxylase] ligase